MDTTRPVLVIGQGSLGTLLGALLADAGHDVHVVSSRADAPERVRFAVRGRRSLEGEVTLRGGPPDEAAWLAIVASRAGDAVERSRTAAGAIAHDGAVAPVHNGLVPLDVAEALGPRRVIPTVVGFNARIRGPETVELTSMGGVKTGALAPAAEPVTDALVSALRGPIPADRIDNPRGAVWSKWCISCAINGLAVVAGEGVGPITRERAGREALVSIVTECVELARAEDVELTRVAGPFAPDTLAGRATSGLGGAFRRGITWLIGRSYQGVVPSSLDALRDGRDPELETITGTAVDLGDEHGVATPWNRAVLDLGREVLEGKREPSTANLEAVRARVLGG